MGRTIEDRYVVEEHIAVGAMGEVYGGRHIQLDRPVAIKLLHPELAPRGEGYERFVREARAAARLDHPHIVDVFDFGHLPEGAPYLVMERLYGQDLRAVLKRRGPMALDEVLEWLAPLARALDYAHRQGVIHRDVKPENIVQHEDGGEVTIKLVDFGLVSLREDNVRLTAQGRVVGTPQYLAPEVAAGNAADARSDIYSLACVAYEMLSGHAPHEAATLIGTLTAKLSDDPSSLSERTGKTFPPALERVMAAALLRDPEGRPRTASAFVTQMQQSASLRSRSAWISMPPAPSGPRPTPPVYPSTWKLMVPREDEPMIGEAPDRSAWRATALAALCVVAVMIGVWAMSSDTPAATVAEAPPMPPPERTEVAASLPLEASATPLERSDEDEPLHAATWGAP